MIAVDPKWRGSPAAYRLLKAASDYFAPAPLRHDGSLSAIGARLAERLRIERDPGTIGKSVADMSPSVDEARAMDALRRARGERVPVFFPPQASDD